jgi:tetratricopeptide (TPR) repeat protein
VVATVQWRSARHEAARANRAKDFIEDMFAPIDASVIEGKQMSVHDLLANATQKLDRNRELDAAERIDLQMLFSRLHEKMGEPEQALALAKQAAEQADAAFGANDAEALAARAAYAYALLEHEDTARAAPMLLALQANVRAGAPLHGMPLVQLDDGLAELADRRGEHALALEHEQHALAERIARFGADSAKAATGYNNVAISLDMSGRHADAIEAFQRSYAIHLAREGADSFETANARSNLAMAEMMAGRLQAARADFFAVEPVFEAAPNNKRNRNVQYWQSRCLLAIGIGGADELPTCERAAQLAKDILGTTAVRLRVRALRVDAQMRMDRGAFAAARADLQQADALLADSGDALSLGVDDYLRAGLDAAQGDAATAAQGFARAIERIGRNFPEYLRLNALAARALACAQHAAADVESCPADAETVARRELDGYDNRWNPWLLPAHIALARIDLDAGKSAAAVARLRQATASAAPEIDPAQLNGLLAQAWLAIAERRDGQCAAAETMQHAVRDAALVQGLDGHPLLREAFRVMDMANACATAN